MADQTLKLDWAAGELLNGATLPHLLPISSTHRLADELSPPDPGSQTGIQSQSLLVASAEP